MTKDDYFKNGNMHNVENYRPVCATSPLYKILDTCVTDVLTFFLKEDY